jgi:hypothetical protein
MVEACHRVVSIAATRTLNHDAAPVIRCRAAEHRTSLTVLGPATERR